MLQAARAAVRRHVTALVMKLSDFDYALPPELIAQHPAAQRAASRLLVLDRQTGAIADCRFADIVDLLNPGDLLVMNNTRVIPARLFGEKETGGRIELLVERVLDTHSVLAQIRASKSPKPGSRLRFAAMCEAQVLAREGQFYRVRFTGERPVLEVLEQIGQMPLPPYITRADNADDRERYQTVYASAPGAVAAPTAGLHFDHDTLAQLKAKGITTGFLTLHVGAGTFQPVRVENIAEHKMHAEWVSVPADLVQQISQTKQQGGRVIAVGTTCVRSLESAARSGELCAYEGETDIFITPGFEFRVIDALLTNFHLPCSTLLMLVCAFAGYEPTMAAYRHAVDEAYRFFSYGDAMLIQ